jgi:hypothetical protein
MFFALWAAPVAAFAICLLRSELGHAAAGGVQSAWASILAAIVLKRLVQRLERCLLKKTFRSSKLDGLRLFSPWGGLLKKTAVLPHT